MDIIKKNLKEWGIDLDKIREAFYKDSSEPEKSIKASKAYIVINCKNNKITIWDFVRDELKEIDESTEFTSYQKLYMQASLLLAWEDLEKNDEKIVIELHDNAK